MRILLLITILIPSITFAQNFRAPAVLPACSINVEEALATMEEIKDILSDELRDEVYKSECIEIKNCMNTADDETMFKLKKIESFICTY